MVGKRGALFTTSFKFFKYDVQRAQVNDNGARAFNKLAVCFIVIAIFCETLFQISNFMIFDVPLQRQSRQEAKKWESRGNYFGHMFRGFTTRSSLWFLIVSVFKWQIRGRDHVVGISTMNASTVILFHQYRQKQCTAHEWLLS